MLTRLTALASFPPALAHELAHYAVAKPFAEHAELNVEITGLHASVRVWWDEEAEDYSRAIRMFANLAPTISGFGIGLLVVLYYVLAGFTLPENLHGWARISLACIVWATYTAPSPGDIQGATRA